MALSNKARDALPGKNDGATVELEVDPLPQPTPWASACGEGIVAGLHRLRFASHRTTTDTGKSIRTLVQNVTDSHFQRITSTALNY